MLHASENILTRAKALLRIFCLLALLGLGRTSQAQTGYLKLTAFPAIALADGRSVVTVTAEVRDAQGKLAPDGTRVLFNTNLGTLRESLVATSSGQARATLTSSSVPGTATVSASCSSLGAANNLDLEFVADRTLLDSSREYAEVASARYLSYELSDHAFAGAAPNQGVFVRYREVTIHCDSMQLDANTLELRAKNARVSFGKAESSYSELYMDLQKRRGVSIAEIEVPSLEFFPGYPLFAVKSKQKRALRLVQITRTGVQANPVSADRDKLFFKPIGQGATQIRARKALVFPRKYIQFHKAIVSINGEKAFHFSLYKFDLNGASPLITDQVVNLNDNRIAINYPQYLTLKPGQTSLLRFRTGDDAGRSFGAIGGAFLDYELAWSGGEQQEGAFVYRGIGRPDFGFNIRQFVRPSAGSSLSMTADTTAFRNLFGSANYNRDLGTFNFGASTTASHSLRGDTNDSRNSFMNLDHKPIRLGKSPLVYSYGLLWQTQNQQTLDQTFSQDGYGVRNQLSLTPRRLGGSANLVGNLALSKLTGSNVYQGLTTQLSLGLNAQPSKNSFANFGYDFVEDGFSSQFTGRHRISVQAGYNHKNLGVNLIGNRSLDLDRQNLQTDVALRLDKRLRVGYLNTFDRYLGSTFFDSGARLIYSYGLRDFGVTYSPRTHRFAIQILGAGAF